MQIADFGNVLNGRPEPTEEQYELARKYPRKHAPELLEMIGLGGAS